MSKKRSSKSWYVKIKSDKDEREERVTGVTSAEAAIAMVKVNEGEEAVSARPVRTFKAVEEVLNDTVEPAVSRTVTEKVEVPAVETPVTEVVDDVPQA